MTKKYVIALFLIGLFSLSCFTLPVPKTINFQGKLISKAGGNPITIPTQITFKLYATGDERDMDVLWHEDNVSATPDASGVFSVTLGPGGSVPLDSVDYSRPLWLELYIDPQTLKPRQPLAASPYAFYAITAEVAVLAHTAETVLSGAPAGGWVDDGTVVRLGTITDKVGIGTASPTASLEVTGNISVDSGNSYFGGRVGIGTASPNTPLYVMGTVEIQPLSNMGHMEALRFRYSPTLYHSIGAAYHGTTPGSNYLSFNVGQGDSVATKMAMALKGDGSAYLYGPLVMTESIGYGAVILNIMESSTGADSKWFGYWTAAGNPRFGFNTLGSAACDGTWGTGGIDYAEWFEKEGDIPEESLIGLNPVTGKVRVWQRGDPFVGIQSPNPGFVGNVFDWDKLDDKTRKKDYACVGLMGQLTLNSKDVVEEGRKVMTADGQLIGWKLSSGKIFIK